MSFNLLVRGLLLFGVDSPTAGAVDTKIATVKSKDAVNHILLVHRVNLAEISSD
jgi:hypothetical protein